MYKDDLEKELKELENVSHYVDTPEFKRHITKLIEERLGELKHSYDCKTLSELATMKGRAKELSFVLNLINGAKEEFMLKKDEFERLDGKSD